MHVKISSIILNSKFKKNSTDCFDITKQLKMLLRNEHNFYGDIPDTSSLTVVPNSCDNSGNETNIISFNELYIVLIRVENTLQKESRSSS